MRYTCDCAPGYYGITCAFRGMFTPGLLRVSLLKRRVLRCQAMPEDANQRTKDRAPMMLLV